MGPILLFKYRFKLITELLWRSGQYARLPISVTTPCLKYFVSNLYSLSQHCVSLNYKETWVLSFYFCIFYFILYSCMFCFISICQASFIFIFLNFVPFLCSAFLNICNHILQPDPSILINKHINSLQSPASSTQYTRIKFIQYLSFVDIIQFSPLTVHNPLTDRHNNQCP